MGDVVGAAGPTELSEADLEVMRARLCAAAGQMAAAECWWLDLVAECDAATAWFGSGIRDCAHWISYSCSMSLGTAREHVRVARALRSLPLIHTEFAAGRLSYSKVREGTRIADKMDEAALLSLMKVATASQFERTVRGYRRSDNERLEQEKRRKARWFTDDDGMLVLTARLPAEEGAEVLAALKTASDELSAAQAAVRAPDTVVADPSISCADALLEVARRSLATVSPDLSGEDRHLVVVHVDANLLAGNELSEPTTPPEQEPDTNAVPAVGCCQVSGVGGIAPETAQRIACDATFVAITRGEGGAVLAHGRRRRLVSAAQRRALMVRDGVCRFPGCRRTTHLEAHHVRSWSAGGKTDLDNLVLLCRLHHVAVHEAGFAITPTLNSTLSAPAWRFLDPRGAVITPDRIGISSPEYPNYFPLTRDLDHVTNWTQSEAEAVRPRWAGERFSLRDIVSVCFDNPRVPSLIT